MASAVDGVKQLETYYGKYLPQPLVMVLAPVGILVYMRSLDPPLAVVVSMFRPLALLGAWLFRRKHTSLMDAPAISLLSTTRLTERTTTDVPR